MRKDFFTNAITCAAVTFLIAIVLVVIPFVFSVIILGIFGILWLFLGAVGWLTTMISIIGTLAVVLFCLPLGVALLAGIIGFFWKMFAREK